MTDFARQLKGFTTLLGAVVAVSALSGTAHAATTPTVDPLANTVWRTFDDKTGTAKALVKFTPTANGTLDANITQTLGNVTLSRCEACKGALKNKPLIGLKIISHLKPTGHDSYEGGEILDPRTGKTYSLKGTLAADGKTLDLRGFMGVALLGRSQTWQREN